MRDPARGHAALRRGRISIPHAEYFLTVCTAGRRAGLTIPAIADTVVAEMRTMEADRAWRLRCTTIMPDHILLLVVLGARLTLGKCIARLKAKTAPTLRARCDALAWERDFFDHHVRPDDDRLGLFLYIFLNPYRSHLCRRDDRWPWFYCCEEHWIWLNGHLADERPIPEWLER